MTVLLYPNFERRNNNTVPLLILLTWLAVVVFVSARHEVFRDEVRALSIALEPSSFLHLPSVLENEGHPVLWYLLLRWAFGIWPSPVILKIVSICVAFSGVVLFYRHAPFPAWQKSVFIFGLLPLYQYAVMARNYGISMLLFFLFAARYSAREKRPFLLALILAALANSNVHSCILSAMLAAFWFFDDVVMNRSSLNFRKSITLVLAFVIVGIGVFGAVVTTFPTPETTSTKALALTSSQVLDAFWTNLKHPGLHFKLLFLGTTVSVRDVILWILVSGLFIRPHASVLLFSGTVLLGTFFSTVYTGFWRHQGILILYIISLYWIVRQQMPAVTKNRFTLFLRKLHAVSVSVVLSSIFIIHLAAAVQGIVEDVSQKMSSSRSFGKFLVTHNEYRDAIIMGEPDYYLESLPYYAPNRIYIPREKRFGNRVMFTTEPRARMSMGELLSIARQIRDDAQKPVLLAMGHFHLYNKQRSEHFYPHNKMFTWSPEELDAFLAQTKKVTEFKTAVGDENYEIYLVLQR